MKASKLESVLSLAGTISILLVVFHRPLGLSDAWEWPGIILLFVFVIALFILQKRRKDRRVRGEIAPEKTSPPRGRFWLILTLLIVVSLAGPLWLPYTGATLPFPMLVLTSVISCIISVAVFIIAWRYWRPKV